MAAALQIWILSRRPRHDECLIWCKFLLRLKARKVILTILQVDIALWDLKARRLGVPIYQLLGGKVRDTLKVYAWIGGDRPSDVEIQA